jgi:mRNA interferase MazF
VPFPFTDLSNVKVRPALVISRSDRADGDVLVAFVGTHHGGTLQTTDLLIEGTDPDFATIGLKTTSFVRLDKIVTLENSILLGEIGELSTALLAEADVKLRHALELE